MKPARIPPSQALRELPVITMITGLTALLLFFCGEHVAFLQYDRTAIDNAEVWRGITSHFIHWSFDHFAWCTITFVALGCICEKLSKIGYLATLLTAACVIPAVSWVADPGMHLYRGLSGLASAIFVFGAAMMMHTAFRDRDWPTCLLVAAAGLGYLAKIVFEFGSGATLFVNSQELFTPVPLAHLVGGLVGLIMVYVFRPKTVVPGMVSSENS